MKVFLGQRFSCELNYQHEVICYELAQKFTITKDVSEADIIVFPSTCACTERTINLVLNYIYNCVSKKKPSAKVYLTGCLTRPFKNSENNKWMQDFFNEYIDFIIPQNKPYLLLQQITSDFSSFSPDHFGCNALSSTNNRAYIYISNGCLNNCAFCKLSYQFYPLKSVELSSLKDTISALKGTNISTVELIGTNICQYGIDLYHEPKILEVLADLEAASHIEQVNLAGFAYKDAIQFNFAPFLAQLKKLTYISGSLETGSPRLLTLINKGYTVEQFISFNKELSSNYHHSLDLNIISGLPTETLSGINATLAVLDEVNPNSVQLCEYINSSMLSLDELPQLSDEEIREHTSIYEEELKRKRIKTTTIYKR